MNATDITVQVSPERPWLGLRSYTSAEQAYFYGRDAQIKDLYQRVRLNPLTVLYGRSGLGKTSLLQAGLLPRLKVEGRDAVLIRLSIDDDASRLIHQVRDALAARLDVPAVDFSLWESAHHEATRAAIELARPVLVFDQFEEVFTLSQRQTRRDRREELVELMAELSALIENRPPAPVAARLESDRDYIDSLDFNESALRIVLTLREDYLHELERWKKLLPSLMRNRMELLELDGTSALRAVIGPGAKGRTPIVAEPVALDIVCFVAQREPGTDLAEIEAVPPLLSLLCAELNEARLTTGAATITAEQAREQSSDILHRFYQRCFEGMPAAVRDVIEDLLIDNSGRYRESSSRDTVLGEMADKAVNDGEYLDTLIERRLLTADVRGGVQRIELTHDLLVPLAAKSRTQADLRRADAKQREQIEAQRQRKLNLWRGRALAATGLLLLVSMAVGAWAYRESRRANEARVDAEDARKKVDANVRQAAERAFGRAQEQLEAGNEPSYYAYLAESLSYRELPEVRQSAVLSLQYMDSVAGSPLLDAPSAVAGLEFSADGKHVLTTHADGIARTWDARSGDLQSVIQLENPIGEARYSADAKRLVIASGSNILVRDEATMDVVYGPLTHEADVVSVALSRDESHLVSIDAAGATRLWNLRGSAPAPIELDRHHRSRSALFSADGTLLLTVNADDQARVWDVATGRERDVIPALSSVRSATFSADAKRVFAIGNDSAIAIWDVAKQSLLGTLQVASVPRSVVTGPDETRLVVQSSSGSTELWDPLSGQRLDFPTEDSIAPPIDGRGPAQRRASFSPDGVVLANIGFGNIRLHDGRTGRVLRTIHSAAGQPVDLKFSPDGTRLALVSESGKAQIVDIRTGVALCETLRHDWRIASAALTDDGTRLLTTTGRHAYIWDARTFAPIREFPPAQPPESTTTSRTAELEKVDGELARGWPKIYGHFIPARAAFDAGAQRVAVAVAPDTLHVYDTATSRLVIETVNAGAQILDIQFAADGTRVLSVGFIVEKYVPVAQISLTDLSQPGGTQSRVFESSFLARLDHAGRHLPIQTDTDTVIHSVVGTPSWISLGDAGKWRGAAFSRDDTILALADDETLRLWNATSGRPLTAPIRIPGLRASLTFSRDGKRIATISGSGADIWNVADGTPAAAPLRHNAAIGMTAFSPAGTELVTASEDGARLWSVASGSRLGPRLLRNQTVTTAQYSSDGKRLVLGTDDGSVCVCEVKSDIAATTRQLIDSLQILGGESVGSDGRIRASKTDRAAFLKQFDKNKPGPDSFLEQIVRWHFTDRAERTIAPFAKTSVARYVQKQIEWAQRHTRGFPDLPDVTYSRYMLMEAYFRDPGNPLILLALASEDKSTETKQFWQTLALKRAQGNASLSIRVAQAFLREQDHKAAAQAVAAALRADPHYPVPAELKDLIAQ